MVIPNQKPIIGLLVLADKLCKRNIELRFLQLLFIQLPRYTKARELDGVAVFCQVDTDGNVWL